MFTKSKTQEECLFGYSIAEVLSVHQVYDGIELTISAAFYLSYT